MQTIRVLLIDDSPLFLATARQFLSAQPGIEITGTALSGSEGLPLVESMKPDVVLLDLCMPQMDGLEATRRIKTGAKAPRVIVVSMIDCASFRSAAANQGADGFVSKSELPAILLPLLRSLFP